MKKVKTGNEPDQAAFDGSQSSQAQLLAFYWDTSFQPPFSVCLERVRAS